MVDFKLVRLRLGWGFTIILFSKNKHIKYIWCRSFDSLFIFKVENRRRLQKVILVWFQYTTYTLQLPEHWWKYQNSKKNNITRGAWSSTHPLSPLAKLKFCYMKTFYTSWYKMGKTVPFEEYIIYQCLPPLLGSVHILRNQLLLNSGPCPPG